MVNEKSNVKPTSKFSVLIAKIFTAIQSSVSYIALFKSATEDQDTAVYRYKDTGEQNTNKRYRV